MFFNNHRKARILWGKSVSLSQNQRHALKVLWEHFEQKESPEMDPLSALNEEERTDLIEKCAQDYPPKRYRSSNTVRLAAFMKNRELGFTNDQSAILVAMLFSYIGR